MNEIWDAYRRDGSKASSKIVKGAEIETGLYHLASEVLVSHRDGHILCLRRSYSKEKYAGYYETTVRGYVLQGEDPLSCLNRELLEKLCIEAFNIRKVNEVVNEKKQTIYHVYMCETSCDFSQVNAPKDEAYSYEWFTREEFIRCMKRSYILPSQYLHFFNVYQQLGFIKSIKDSDIYNKPIEVVVDSLYKEEVRNKFDLPLNTNYGYVEGLLDEKGKPIRAYVIGLTIPVIYAQGYVSAVITYKDGRATKLVVSPENMLFTRDQIREIIEFNEQDGDFELNMTD